MHSLNRGFRNADLRLRIPQSAFHISEYRLFSEAGRMRVVKFSCFLIRTGECQELAVLVMPAQEGDAQGCPGASDTIVVPRIG